MSRISLFVGLIAGLAFSAASAHAAGRPSEKPPSLAPIAEWVKHKEFVEMLTGILRGDMLQGGPAWFHPGQSAYSCRWLVARYDADHDGGIGLKEWPGPRALFERLDRDHDGRLTPVDFDWSDDAPLNKQIDLANQLFRRAAKDGDDHLTAEEWQKLFKKASGGKKTLTRDQLHALLFPPPPRDRPRMAMPSRWTLLRGLLSGEVGSALEGPAVGQPGPEFTLPTHDAKRLIRLCDYRGRKPVVLIFGSFT
jgi:hypothetical protein